MNIAPIATPLNGSAIINYNNLTNQNVYGLKQSQINFIKNDLILGIDSLINKHGQWLAPYVLIGIGIEHLGACIDSYDFFIKDLSKKRFDLAIEKLFKPINESYFIERQKLYEDFRCGFCHTLIPKPSIIFCNNDETNIHLSREEQKAPLKLNLKKLFNDFKIASEIVIQKLETGEINPKYSINSILLN